MSKHVVFVGLDGAQYSKLLALGSAAGGLTNLDSVEAFAGGTVGTATQQPTVSGPGWSTLLTGVWANEHGITSNNNSPVNSAVQSLFERVDAGIEDAKIASIVHWGDINTGHFGDETGLRDGSSIVDFEAHGLSDQAVVDRGVDLITNEAPDFTFLHLDDPDGVGHSQGFGAAYDAELKIAADQVNQIMTAVAERMAANPDEEWMVIVSTDHGRDPNGFGHGGQTAGERQIFVASNLELSSNGAAPQTSVAATILDFLGLDATGVQGPSLLDEEHDNHAPYVVGTTPADDLQNVPADAPLTLILSEKVQKGEGAITIHRASDGAVVETIDVASDQVGIASGVVTVHLSGPLAVGTEYYVNVDAGAFVDYATGGTETVRLFSENFEGLVGDLQGYVSATEKQDADTTDWTASAPDGWTIDNSTTPKGSMSGGTGAGGPQEFYGWTFHDKNAWIDTSYNQNRSQFTKGQGVVAVADPDEYDDIAASSSGGTSGILANGGYKTLLTTSAINVTGLVDNKATLTFDSSWRQETYQEARVIVTFDNGQTVELMHWNSGRAGAGGVFKADATNETVTLTIDIPEGATTATIGFDMVNAGNNWWWAIDNIALDAQRTSEAQGNPFAGIDDTTTWNFTTSSDTPLPQIVSVTPADDDGTVATDAPLTITFDEAVRIGEGAIVIHRADGSIVETIDVGSERVSIDGAVVTVHPAELEYGTGYYVTVDAGAFRDFDTAQGSAFEGLDDASGWNFTTEADSYGPEVSGTTPADEAGEVAPTAPLTITFDEAVRKGVGEIVLHRVDGSVVETIDVASEAVSIDGKTVTIQPGAALPAGDYYVTVAEGAFEDLALHTEKVLFSENFEELTSLLQSYSSPTETVDGDPTDWTATLPEGWTRNNGTTPTGGPAEFFGWTFHDKDAWIATAGDQGRVGFTKGQGVVAVADGDEYDDGAADVDGGKYMTWMRTPNFNVAGLQDNQATLTFDSSWLPESPQEVRLVVTFDNGETIELLHWNSGSGGGTNKPSAINETVSLTINVPEGAHTANLAFDMVKSGNNWWWAIDNIAVTGNTPEPHGNAFAGIDDETTWNFSVADQTPVATEFDDELTGTSGDDVIAALAGDDQVSGDAGKDDLDGGIGDDTLLGGEGDDILRGGVETDPAVAGDDALFGGAGDDILIGGAGDDTLDGGEGSDTADYADDTAGIVVDLAAGTAEGDAIGSDELSSIETVIAGSGDDVLAGDAGDNRLNGGAGHDTLVLAAASGAIALDLAAGTVSAAGLGTDSFTAIEAFQLGEGDDTVTLIAGAAAVAIDGGEGHDTLVLTGTGTLGELSHVEAIALQGNWTLTDEGYDVAFQDGAQTLTLDEGLLADGQFTGTISGLSEDDRIELSGLAATQATLGEGNLLTITGGANGPVTLQLDPAADFTGMAFSLASNGQGGSYLSYGPANAGDDVMTGGNGNDSFDGGAGNDTLKGAAGNDTLNGGEGNDLIDGGSGDDSVHGGTGNDTIKAGSGTDTIDAGAGDDLVDAGSGDDVILAGAGNDSVEAGSGDDRIEGGAGDDVLTGGSGHDVFVFAAGFGKDVISDFKTTGTSSDVLEFSHDVFTDATAALAAAHQDGSDVVFAIDADTTLTLKNVQLASLHDFHFA